MLHLAEYLPAALPPVGPDGAPPKGAGKIGLAEAARRSGLSVGQLRRRCLEDWGPRGLAIQERPAEGGKPTWMVWDYADPSLSRVPASQRQDDLSDFTDAQRAQILERRATLDAWQTAVDAAAVLGLNRDKATDQFLLVRASRGSDPVSRRTLYNWAQRDHRRNGLAVLADRRTVKNEEANPFAAFFEAVKDLYLAPNELSIALCHQAAALDFARQGRASEVPHPSTTWREIQRIPKAVRDLRRKGDKYFNDKHAPHLTRDYTLLASNEIWCGDHHKFDVMVRIADGPDGRKRHDRPWLTAWEDLRSRKIVGYSIGLEDPSADVILTTFRDAAIAHGLPSTVLIDNGKDYDARALQGFTKKQRAAAARKDNPIVISEYEAKLRGAFPILGVAVQHARKYHGQSKPIERLFRTVCDRFARLFATYCGNKPENKPDGLEDRLANGEAVNLEEFKAAFAQWLAVDYNGKGGHLGDGMDGDSPDVAFERHMPAAGRRTATESQLNVACLSRVEATVHRNGVTWRKLKFGAFDPAVIALRGRKVMLGVNPDDTSRVAIFDMDGRPLAVANANIRTPFDRDSNAVKAGQKLLANARRAAREYHRQRPALSMDLHTATQLAAARASRPAVIDAVRSTPAPSYPAELPFTHDEVEALSSPPPARSPMRIGPIAEEAPPARREFSFNFDADAEEDRHG
jgi:hypothetical protein